MENGRETENITGLEVPLCVFLDKRHEDESGRTCSTLGKTRDAHNKFISGTCVETSWETEVVDRGILLKRKS